MAMTVKDLREALDGLPDDLPVILQKDGEGNGYSPLSVADADNCSYLADSTWSGTVGLTELRDGDRSAGYGEEDVIDGGVPCLVLAPVN